MDRRNARDERHHDATSLAQHFSSLAQKTALWTGQPLAFIVAVLLIIAWGITGPIFHYSDTWQLVINTGTTIVTFLMVFLIQNTQNRDTMAIQLKLSELVLAMKGAENKFAALEDLTDEELHQLHDECRARVETTLSHIERRRSSGVQVSGPKKAAAHGVRSQSRKSQHARRS